MAICGTRKQIEEEVYSIANSVTVRSKEASKVIADKLNSTFLEKYDTKVCYINERSSGGWVISPMKDKVDKIIRSIVAEQDKSKSSIAVDFVKEINDLGKEPQTQFNYKKQVSDVFESDTDLANAVYKALGFTEIESVHTARGSTYRYLPDGKTQRFKKVEGKEYDPQDVLVFVPNYQWVKNNNSTWLDKNGLENAVQYEEYLLESVQGKGDKILITDFKGNVINNNKEATEAGRVFMTFLSRENGNVTNSIPVSSQPIKDFYTYDTRSFIDKDKIYKKERHIGNKVIDIKYKNVNSQQKQQAQEIYSKYLQTTNNPTIEGFKNWLKNNPQQKQNIPSSNKLQKVNNQDTQLKVKYFKDNNVQKASTVLKEIAKSDHPLASLASHLLKNTKGKFDVNITLINQESFPLKTKLKDGSVVEDEVSAYYSKDSNEIFIAEKANYPASKSESSIINNIIHALTHNALEGNSDAKYDLNNLYLHAKTEFKKLNTASKYPLTNINDFIAGLFTSPSFIRDLAKLNPLGSVRTYKNFFHEVLDHILKYLGLSKGTLYDQAFAVATNIINENTALEESSPYQKDNPLRTYDDEGNPLPVSEQYQLFTDEKRKKIDNDLDAFMGRILDKLGVDYEQSIEQYRKDYKARNPGKEINMIALADLFRNIIAINEDKRDGTTLAEEGFHFLIDMFWDDPLVKNIRELKSDGVTEDFKRSTIWINESNSYRALYNDETLVEKEVIGKLFARAIYDQYQKETFLGKITDALNRVLSFFFKSIGQRIKLKNIELKGYSEELGKVLNSSLGEIRTQNFVDNLTPRKETVGEINANTGIVFSEKAARSIINALEEKLSNLKDKSVNRITEEMRKEWADLTRALHSFKDDFGDVLYEDHNDLIAEIERLIDKGRTTGNLSLQEQDTLTDLQKIANNLSSSARYAELYKKIKPESYAANQVRFLETKIKVLQKQISDKKFEAGIFMYFFGPDGDGKFGAIQDINYQIERIDKLNKDKADGTNKEELTAEEFDQIHNALAYYAPIVRALADAYDTGFSFPELSDENNKKLSELLKELRKDKIEKIETFLVERQSDVIINTFKEKQDVNTTRNFKKRLAQGEAVRLFNLNWWKYWLGSSATSVEDFLGIFNEKVVSVANNVQRLSTEKMTNLYNNIREEIKGFSDKDMRMLMESDDSGNPTGYYLNPYEVARWEKNRERAGKKIRDEVQALGKKHNWEVPEDREMRHRFFKGEFIPVFDFARYNELEALKESGEPYPIDEYNKLLAKKLTYEDQVSTLSKMKDLYRKKWAQWFKTNTMVRPDFQSIIDEKRNSLSKIQFNAWYNRVKKEVSYFDNATGDVVTETYYTGELSVPSNGTNGTVDYSSKEYNNLSAKHKKVLDELLKTKRELLTMLPIHATYEISVRLPQVTKSAGDILHSGAKNAYENLGDKITDLFVDKPDDPLFGGDMNIRPTLNRPPVRFVKMSDNPKILTQDLLKSMAMFSEMAYNYQEYMKALPELDGMVKSAKYNVKKYERKGLIKNPDGTLDLNNFGFDDTIPEENYLIRKMNNLMNVFVYGKKIDIENDANLKEMQRTVAPIITSFANYVRANRLLGNITSVAKGYVTAVTDTIGEGFLSRYFTNEDLKFGTAEFIKSRPLSVLDSNSPIKRTKLDALAVTLGISNHLNDNFQNLARTRLYRRMSKVLGYGAWEASDVGLKYPMLAAIGNNMRFHNGKLYSKENFPDKANYDKAKTFYDSFTVENGLVKFDKDVSIDDINYFTNYIKTVSSRMDAVLQPGDRGAIYNHTFGQLGTVTMGFLFQQLDTGGILDIRSKNKTHFNYLLRREEAQLWKSVFRNNIMSLIPSSEAWKNMSPAEREAIKKFYMFMSTAAIFGTLAFMLNALGADDDDDDDPLFKYLTYITTGSYVEQYSRLSIDDGLRYLSNPLSAVDDYNTILNGFLGLFSFLGTGDTVGKNSIYSGYDKGTRAAIKAIPGLRGWFETLWGGYVNEALDKPETSIAQSIANKNNFLKNQIINKNIGLPLAVIPRTVGNVIGELILDGGGEDYDYDFGSAYKLPDELTAKERKEMEGESTSQGRDVRKSERKNVRK